MPATIFHATELFSGGRYFDRVTWPLCVRWAILEELASIPREFDLPVVFGFQIRKQIPSELDGERYTDKIRTTASQLHAFSIAWSA
jgi:hypothetical protein